MKSVLNITLDITVNGDMVNISRDGEDWSVIHLGSNDTLGQSLFQIFETIFIFESMM